RSILVPALDVLDSSQNVVSLMVAQRDESLVTRAMRARIVQQRSITCSAGGHSPRQHLHTVAEQAVGAKQDRIPPRGGNKPAAEAHRVSGFQNDVLVRNPVVRRRFFQGFIGGPSAGMCERPSGQIWPYPKEKHARCDEVGDSGPAPDGTAFSFPDDRRDPAENQEWQEQESQQDERNHSG